MTLLIILLRIFEVIVCLMLIGIILLQRTKGSGAGVSFGGGMAESLFGAQMGNVLTKGTVILGIVFLLNTIVLSILQAKQSGLAVEGSLMDAAPPAPVSTVPATAGDPATALPAQAPSSEAASALDDVPRGDAPTASATAAGAPAAQATPAPAAAP